MGIDFCLYRSPESNGPNLPDRAQGIAAAGSKHRAGFHHEPRALGVEPAVRP